MKVSIITPTFNSCKTIIDTLNSIKIQTYSNIEHLIIDGRSTDETLNLCRRFSPRSIIISERDDGIYDAMNKGIEMARGEIIGILNSDDFYTNNNIIEIIADVFRENGEIQVVYGNLIYVKGEDTSIAIREWLSRPYYNKFFEDANVPPHPTLFVRREVYQQVGMFDLSYKLAADYEFMFRVLKLNNIRSYYVNEFFVKMRTGGATSKSFHNILIQNFEILRCWKEWNFKLPSSFWFKKLLNRILQFFIY